MDDLEFLSPKQRKAIYLRFWDNRTVFNIAQIIGVSWVEADKIINEGLSQLRSLSLLRVG
jgi:DNA-directed RNA polymerase specialized sigma24 family protein